MPVTTHHRNGVARRRGRCPQHRFAIVNGKGCPSCPRPRAIAKVVHHEEPVSFDAKARAAAKALTTAPKRKSLLATLTLGLLGGRVA